MKNVYRWASLTSLLLLAGCATPDAQMQQMQQDNQRLRQQVEERDTSIADLNQKKLQLEGDLAYTRHRAEVLDREKGARIQEAAELRRGVREFTDSVMTSLQTYFQRAEIVDYVGNEIFERGKLDAEAKDRLLVNVGMPLPANGTVIGGRAYVAGPSRLQFCLLRPSGSGKHTVVGLTPVLNAEAAGAQAWTFDVPMVARKGDLLAVYMPDVVSIPFDDADTGDVLLVPASVKPDATVALPASLSKLRRAYSFGIVGYFQTN